MYLFYNSWSNNDSFFFSLSLPSEWWNIAETASNSNLDRPEKSLCF